MNRPVSPLRHDYKTSAYRKPAKPKALQWFAVGLGIPLIAVFLLDARQISWNVDKGQDRDIEAVEQSDEASRLVRGVDVERAGHVSRIVGDDADDHEHADGYRYVHADGHRHLHADGNAAAARPDRDEDRLGRPGRQRRNVHLCNRGQ